MPAKKPGTPKEPKAAPRVRITLNDAKADFQEKVNIQLGIRTAAPQAPKFTVAIKTPLDAWSASTDQARAQYATIISAEAALEQGYGALGTTLLQVGLNRDAFVNALQNVCANPDDAKSFGVSTVTHGTYVPPNAPVSIRQIATAVPGSNRVRWLSEAHAGSYQAERSVDPPTATSWVACYTGTPPFFLLTGSPGDRVWVRICSVGKLPSAWSTAFLIILR
jgi:hypothetical protein